MVDTDDIVSQVMLNCSISDSQHAGLYSICGLALRLRDLYKWEKGLEPWVERDSAEILAWIGEKEEEWDRLADKDFKKIRLDGREYDPFDSRGINEVLEAQGLFYGAGYVYSLKPTFFLADIEEKKVIDGYPVHVLGHELARDILTLPAMSRDNCILIRKDSIKRYLWDQIFFIKNSGRKALGFAMKTHGIAGQDSNAIRQHLDRIVEAEKDVYIYHEIGEMRDQVFDRDIWQEIIAAFPHTPLEFFARAVKDQLADTNEYGKLKYIIRERKGASLAFHVVFLDGLRKELFPEIIPAFHDYVRTGDWHFIRHAVATGFSNAKNHADLICRIYQKGKERNDLEWAEDEIDRRLLAPMGIGKVNQNTAE
ncbi:Sfum_1244 family protein [Thermodesulfobacteriota bacterium]